MRKEIIIVRTLKGERYAQFIAKEINIRGYQHKVVPLSELEEYIQSNNLNSKNTLIHTRTASPGKVYAILSNLKNQGFTIINDPETVRLTSDKFNACDFALKNNLPCATTWKKEKSEAATSIREIVASGKIVIVKPVVSQGQGIYCLKFDQNNLQQIGEIENIPSEHLVLQEFINYTRLSRVIVIGFKALRECVFYDEPHGQDWKCSVCLNNQVQLDKNPPEALLNLAEETAKKFNSEIGFIDIFSTENGFVLNEINTACSLIIHEQKSGINLSGKIAEYLVASYKKRVEV